VERAKLGWQHAVAVSVATSPKLTHHLEVNEFVVRLAVEAQAAGGMLTHWHGERWLHRAFDGMLIPDTYAALAFRDRPALHMLVELDRGTETLETLRDKAERYERRLDYKFWREVDPIVLFVVPSEGRARTVTDALTGMSRSLAVIVWSKDATLSALTASLEAEQHRRLVREWEQRREREDAEIRRDAQAASVEGRRDGVDEAGRLRSARASDLLDQPQAPEQEPS
jgi:protein involved in plasmid replication-relaxation